MIETQTKLILSFSTQKISEEEFLSKLSKKPAKEYLEQEFIFAIESKNSIALDNLFLILKYLHDEFLYNIFKKLILEDWHYRNEDIAGFFQFYFKNPDCIDTVVEAMHLNCDHWDEEIHRDPFVRKCAYVLGSLKTSYSIEKLKELYQSDDHLIRMYSEEQLSNLGIVKQNKYWV